MSRECSVDLCHNKHYGLGFCLKHYKRHTRHGCHTVTLRNGNNTVSGCSVEGCQNNHFGKGYCKKHLQRYKKYGDPLSGKTFMNEPLNWINAHKDYIGEECLIWPFTKHRLGYGRVKYSNGSERRKSTFVHILMCEYKNGKKLHENLEVRHLCGNGHIGCVNPNHLQWGTHKENMEDLVREKDIFKIKKHQVISILNDTRSYSVIAKEYNTSSSHVSRIKNGQRWGIVTGKVEDKNDYSC